MESIALGVIALVAVIVMGITATVAAPRVTINAGVRDLVVRCSTTVTASIANLGRFGTAAVVFLAGGGLIIATCWPLGLLAHSLQNAIDWPVFDWIASHRVPWWSKLWEVLTNLGGLWPVRVLLVMSIVFFAITWHLRGRRWWAPALVLLFGYVLEYSTQMLLILAVDRGHPPTSRGTWPSGGCARVMAIEGLVIYFCMRWSKTKNRRYWAMAGTLLAFLVTVQAYARLYNQEHWLTDVLGGVIFGGILLAINIIAFEILDHDLDVKNPPERGQQLLRAEQLLN